MAEIEKQGGAGIPYGNVHPLKLFDVAKSEARPLYASAPMVRYSKLAFRETVHNHGVDLCWTPMILAKEFNRSGVARDSDFTIPAPSSPQIPTIAQLASSSAHEFAGASLLLAPHVQGIDLNCGCPQSWACAESLGAALMNQRSVVAEMVSTTKQTLLREGLGETTVSVKIRVHKDLRQTVDFIRTVQDAGVDFITIHGRTRSTPSSHPVDLEAIALLSSHCSVPVIANGDVTSISTAHSFAATTGVDGVMAARSLLCNPALFDRNSTMNGNGGCTWETVDTFLNNVIRAPLPLKLTMHHLTEMCGPVATELGGGEALLNKNQRAELIACSSMLEVIDFLDSVREIRRL